MNYTCLTDDFVHGDDCFQYLRKIENIFDVKHDKYYPLAQ